MTGSVDCGKYFEKISELLDGELDSDAAETIRKHIEACPECRVCWATFRKSVELFRNLDDESYPPNMLDDLKEFIRKNNSG